MTAPTTKTAIKAAHAKVATCYGFAEHGCAIAYALCEFFNAHLMLIGCSLVLLGAAITYLGLKLAEVI